MWGPPLFSIVSPFSSLLNVSFVGQPSSHANTPLKPISSALHSFEQLMGETSRGQRCATRIWVICDVVTQ